MAHKNVIFWRNIHVSKDFFVRRLKYAQFWKLFGKSFHYIQLTFPQTIVVDYINYRVYCRILRPAFPNLPRAAAGDDVSRSGSTRQPIANKRGHAGNDRARAEGCHCPDGGLPGVPFSRPRGKTFGGLQLNYGSCETHFCVSACLVISHYEIIMVWFQALDTINVVFFVDAQDLYRQVSWSRQQRIIGTM